MKLKLKESFKYTFSLTAVLFAVAFLLRVFFLELKPVHFDESINGWFVGQMWDHGFYRYDPSNYHGPLHFYLLQVSELVFGHSLWSLRFVSVFFSMISLVLIWSWRSFFGSSIKWGVSVLAVSAGLVFYSRTAIHETAFLFFQILCVHGVFHYTLGRKHSGFFYAFMGLIGCILYKETFVIFLTAFGVSLVIDHLFFRVQDNQKKMHEEGGFAPTIATSVFSGLLFLVVFYSGFFQDPEGLNHMISSMTPWLKEGLESGHEKPWHYFFGITAKYEPLIGLVLFIGAWQIRTFRRHERILWLLGAGTFFIYSLIPYKTPWLILSALWPLGLLAGALVRLSSSWKYKQVFRYAFAAFFALGLYQSLRVNFYDYESPKDEYVYVQTRKDVKELAGLLGVFKNPLGGNTNVRMAQREPWPWPYLLRRWSNVSYLGLENVNTARRLASRQKLSSDVLFLERDHVEVLKKQLEANYLYKEYLTRDGREPAFVAVKKDYLETSPKKAEWLQWFN